MKSLDDSLTFAADREGMLGHADALGRELAASWEASESVTLPDLTDLNGLVIAGVGGSASAADAFAALANDTARIPITVTRGFSLPGWVTPGTLVVVSSYSGETDEALAMFEDAQRRGAPIVVITSGGKLAAMASAAGSATYSIAYRSQPRAAFAHGLGPLLYLGRQLGLTQISGDEVRAAAAAHGRWVQSALGPAVPQAHNPAKRLAMACERRLPWVLGAGHLAPSATRFKNQFAENGKRLAAAETLPEAGHNLIVGLDEASSSWPPATLITLESARWADRSVQSRFEAFATLWQERGLPAHRCIIDGATQLDDILLATALGDFTSCYIGLLRGIDPSPVAPIDAFKRRSAPA